MSTKPKFLTDIEKRILKSSMKDSNPKIELYRWPEIFFLTNIFLTFLFPARDVFTILIENIQTFGPVLSTVMTGYETHIRHLRENMKYLEYTNAQLYDEMRKFQEEISSDEDEKEEEKEGAGRKEARQEQGLIEKLRKKREKEKQRRLEKLWAHQEEVEKYQERIADLQMEAGNLRAAIQERVTKYELLAEEFTAVQKNFSAYRASREQSEALSLVEMCCRYCALIG